MAFLTFDDGSGATQIDNGFTAIAAGVASRFSNWVSDPDVVGPQHPSLGTGTLYVFEFRTDYKASFDLLDIPNSQIANVDRLIRWLLRGGVVSVTTGDNAARVYATCCLVAGTKPSKKLSNRQDLTWTLSLILLNLAGAPMLCIYDA